MDLDLAQVRAFVFAAEDLHFGRAAARLFLTQQAVSKRIQRLEAMLGEELFVRDHQAVMLTPAGERFLAPARQLLELAETAARAGRRVATTPIRVDVWGPVHLPLRILRDKAGDQGLIFELSMRRSLANSLTALERGELDVAFGRPHDLGRPMPANVSRRLLFLEPIAAAVVKGHPFASLPRLTAEELRQSGVWFPFTDTPSELVGLLTSFVEHLGVPHERTPENMGVEYTLDSLRAHPHRVTPFGALWQVPGTDDIAVIPLEPTPYLPWSVLWRADNPHPMLPALLESLEKASDAGDWLRFDARRDWLPAPDLEELDQSRLGWRGAKRI